MWSISWLFVLLAVVIVAVNIIIIVIFTTNSRLRSRKHALIVSLAVADLFVGLVSVPANLLLKEHPTLNRSWVFLLVYFVQDHLFGGASILGLAALAIERSYATYFPFKYRSLSKLPYIIGIAVVWALAIISSVASFAMLMNMLIRLLLIAKVVIQAILLVTICGAYLLIFFKGRCMALSTNQFISRRNKKLTVTLAIVTIVSLVTWVPYKIIMAYTAVHLHNLDGLHWAIGNFTQNLQYVHSLANFLVYAFRMLDFQRELTRRFRCCCCNNKIEPNGRGIELQSNIGKINDIITEQ